MQNVLINISELFLETLNVKGSFFMKYLGVFQALLSLNICIYRIFSEYEHRSFFYYFENYIFRKKKESRKRKDLKKF